MFVAADSNLMLWGAYASRVLVSVSRQNILPKFPSSSKSVVARPATLPGPKRFAYAMRAQ
jgi:hypothetical protein